MANRHCEGKQNALNAELDGNSFTRQHSVFSDPQASWRMYNLILPARMGILTARDTYLWHLIEFLLYWLSTTPSLHSWRHWLCAFLLIRYKKWVQTPPNPTPDPSMFLVFTARLGKAKALTFFGQTQVSGYSVDHSFPSFFIMEKSWLDLSVF